MVNDYPLIGKQVGNYRVLDKINSGSFGSVYQGKHIIFEDDPVVAIKLLHTTLHSQQEHTEFIKEAQMLKKLHHPHILRILDAGFQDSIPYLVTEYAARGSLRDRLLKSNNQPLPLDEAISILRQIGQSLHYAHQQHIIHRDLKPENILFNEIGEALLADFGIAVVLATAYTGQVGLSGTPPYMAPEQFEGLASPKSDQYTLGCIAYELVTGRRLFNISNATLEAYWYHHTKVKPTPPSHYHPQLPAHIEQAILIAVAKDRTQRHKDVITFSNALLKSSKAWLDEGNNHFTEQHFEEALDAFEQAIRLESDHFRLAQIYCYKGKVLEDLKQYVKALAAFDQAIHLDPYLATAYYGKGKLLIEFSQYLKALANFDRTIRLDPTYVFAYHGMGCALYGLNRYEEAEAAFDQVIRLNPNYPLAYIGKGNSLQNLGKTKEATQAFEKARQLGDSR